jgi:hypothetical protein
MIITGLFFYLGDDVSRFYAKNKDHLDGMWADIGEYYGVGLLLRVDLDDYIEDYAEALEDLDANELQDIGDKYSFPAFDDLSRIYRDFEDYLPSLRLGVIACLIASVMALIGTEVARRYRVAGGVMVLAGAALTLIFSLVASSIITMALASVLLIAGGLLQIAKPKAHAVQETPTVSGGGIEQ